MNSEAGTMVDELTVESLRAAIRGSEQGSTVPDAERFHAMGRRFEAAVRQLIQQVNDVVSQISELHVTLEDEVEEFTSPAFPGQSMEIRDQRLRITHQGDVLLFDPTAKALLSALGQVEIEATRPIPFLIERILYLVPNPDGRGGKWGVRSVENLGGPLQPFSRQILLRMLQAVFADD
ncbi:MAG: hypothetical protein GY906_23715 [bacterium]|nr:hypothetical protein [bacterium]